MFIQNYGLPKSWLDKYEKISGLEYPCKRNMVNGLKHCSNLNGGTFMIFIDHCERN